MMNNLDYKSLMVEELQYIFSDVDFSLEPMRHQFISLAFAIDDRNRVAFLHDVGTGKTLCALYALRLWNCKKTLVVCPPSAFGSWRRDLENNTNFSYAFLTGSGKNRKQLLKQKRDVYIIQYEGLKTLYSKLSRIKGEGWGLPDSFIHNFDCIVLDEAHKVKSYDALQSKICFELSRRAKHVIGLTGTLIDESYLELHNIYRVIDLGKSLGSNFFAYRYRYFDREVCGSKWSRKKWIEWKLKPGCEEEILDKISGTSISFGREECFDLPPIQKIFKWISPSKQFLQLQEDIVNNKSSCALSKELIGSKIKTKAHILRELPSGFFYYGKDKKVVRLSNNPKVEALLDLLEDSSSKVIVFYRYVEERNIIENALAKEKISFSSAYGGQDNREEEIYKFQNNKNVRVLVSQITVANEGYDAFAANVVVFFRPLSSPKMIKQCIGRAHRKGQQRKVLVVTFVMEDSIEERVIVNRSKRFNLVREAEDYIRNFHKGSEVDEV